MTTISVGNSGVQAQFALRVMKDLLEEVDRIEPKEEATGELVHPNNQEYRRQVRVLCVNLQEMLSRGASETELHFKANATLVKFTALKKDFFSKSDGFSKKQELVEARASQLTEKLQNLALPQAVLAKPKSFTYSFPHDEELSQCLEQHVGRDNQDLRSLVIDNTVDYLASSKRITYVDYHERAAKATYDACHLEKQDDRRLHLVLDICARENSINLDPSLALFPTTYSLPPEKELKNCLENCLDYVDFYGKDKIIHTVTQSLGSSQAVTHDRMHWDMRAATNKVCSSSDIHALQLDRAVDKCAKRNIRVPDPTVVSFPSRSELEPCFREARVPHDLGKKRTDSLMRSVAGRVLTGTEIGNIVEDITDDIFQGRFSELASFVEESLRQCAIQPVLNQPALSDGK